MAARVASTVLDELTRRDAVANARRMEDLFRAQMAAAIGKRREHCRLRATGLCLALETHHPDYALQVARSAFDVGLRIRAIDQNVIACPPLVMSEDEISQMSVLLSRALDLAERR